MGALFGSLASRVGLLPSSPSTSGGNTSLPLTSSHKPPLGPTHGVREGGAQTVSSHTPSNSLRVMSRWPSGGSRLRPQTAGQLDMHARLSDGGEAPDVEAPGPRAEGLAAAATPATRQGGLVQSGGSARSEGWATYSTGSGDLVPNDQLASLTTVLTKGGELEAVSRRSSFGSQVAQDTVYARADSGGASQPQGGWRFIFSRGPAYYKGSDVAPHGGVAAPNGGPAGPSDQLPLPSLGFGEPQEGGPAHTLGHAGSGRAVVDAPQQALAHTPSKRTQLAPPVGAAAGAASSSGIAAAAVEIEAGGGGGGRSYQLSRRGPGRVSLEQMRGPAPVSRLGSRPTPSPEIVPDV